MANHMRRQIREAIGALVTGLSTTGANVFQSRVYPAEASKLPCLLVSTKSESVTPSTVHPARVLERLLTVEVAVVAKATADLDDTLDGICKEVEIALADMPSSLLSLCDDIVLQSTDIELSDGADKPVGIARLSYSVSYYTHDNSPDAAL